MSCAPCAAARAAALKQAKEGHLLNAAKIVVAGAEAMVGAISKEEMLARVDKVTVKGGVISVERQ